MHAEGGELVGVSKKGRILKDVPRSQDFYSKCNKEGLHRILTRDLGLGVTLSIF